MSCTRQSNKGLTRPRIYLRLLRSMLQRPAVYVLEEGEEPDPGAIRIVNSSGAGSTTGRWIQTKRRKGLANILSPNGHDKTHEIDPITDFIRAHANGTTQTPIKRRPGRPPRRPEAILQAFGVFTPQPKVFPPPGPNPCENRTPPQPSF
ncbi:hypothetical protein BDW72DRAFT_195750 [Aspergillus terricola var. indicus]